MALGCRIITDFKRPDPKLIESFSGMAVADLDDSMSKISAVRHKINSFNYQPILGTAFTVKLPHGDNLVFRAAIKFAKPGDVIVIDAGGFEDRAVIGEVTARLCKARGVRGIICDGAIRDSLILAEMEDFSVFARAVSPNGPYFNGPGEVNVPIVCGGQIVHPGDIVVGDSDGIVFIDPATAEDVLIATKAAHEKEEKLLKQIEETGTCDQEWVYAKLAKMNCEYVDLSE